MPALVEPLRKRNVSSEVLGERTCVIRVEGRFTSRAAITFAERLRAARGAGCRDFVLDLTSVGPVDSVGAMIFCEQRLQLADCSVVVAADRHEAIVALAEAPVLADWPLRATVAEALSVLLLEPVA